MFLLKLLKFLPWIKKKERKRQDREKELLTQYENGRILQIDNGENNKEYLKNIKCNEEMLKIK